MSDIGPRICDISAGLGEDALVVITIEEGILDVTLAAALALATAAHTVGLETSLLENDEEPALGGGSAVAGYMCLHGEHERVCDHRSRVLCRRMDTDLGWRDSVGPLAAASTYEPACF